MRGDLSDGQSCTPPDILSTFNANLAARGYGSINVSMGHLRINTSKPHFLTRNGENIKTIGGKSIKYVKQRINTRCWFHSRLASCQIWSHRCYAGNNWFYVLFYLLELKTLAQKFFLLLCRLHPWKTKRVPRPVEANVFMSIRQKISKNHVSHRQPK